MSKLVSVIAKKLVQTRENCGFSIQEVSEATEIPMDELARYEDGTEDIYITDLLNILTLYATDIDSFFEAVSGEDEVANEDGADSLASGYTLDYRNSFSG